MSRRIGFVGVGTMGRPMAHNLLRAGFTVTVCPHMNMAPVQELEAAGAAVAADPRAVAAASEVIITCLPNSPQVEEALFGPAGVMGRAAPGTIIVDSSTISPAATRDFARRVAEAGCTLLDAPVSGGEGGAIAGTLTFMVGGDQEALDAVRDVLGAMGRRIYHMGPSGMGEVTKLCNNMMAAINLVGASEAFTMGAKAGLDPVKLAEVVGVSSGASGVVEKTFPNSVLKNRYEPGFMLKLMVKDLRLALDQCEQLGVPAFTGSAVAQVMEMVQNMGKGDADFTVVSTLYQEVAGLVIADTISESESDS
jgi:3-hydroxyisobutyrate dehydrogenase